MITKDVEHTASEGPSKLEQKDCFFKVTDHVPTDPSAIYCHYFDVITIHMYQNQD